LSFEQLSWPSEEALSGESGAAYRASAHLLVNELLRLNNGRACLRAMLADLPKKYNWQFAFLHGFQSHFQRPLEIEKWWALHAARFTGHDSSRAWALRESCERLSQALQCPVQIYTQKDDLPLHTQATLQTVIRQWERARQQLILTSKLRDLDWLRLRVSPEIAELVESYRHVLENFLQNRDRTGSILPFSKKAALRRLTDQTVAELDALDSQRQAIQLQPTPVAAARSESAIKPE